MQATAIHISQFILLPLSFTFVICFSSDTGYSSVPHSIEEIRPMSLANEVKKVKRRILEREKEIYYLRKWACSVQLLRTCFSSLTDGCSFSYSISPSSFSPYFNKPQLQVTYLEGQLNPPYRTRSRSTSSPLPFLLSLRKHPLQVACNSTKYHSFKDLKGNVKVKLLLKHHSIPLIPFSFNKHPWLLG